MKPDADVLGWAVELVLRDPDKESIAKQLLDVVPLPNKSPRLTKTILLRSIQIEASDSGSVSEAILDALESIAALDRKQGIPITEYMRAAYCAVATDCTVKFLVFSEGIPTGKYHEAVNRIWRGRVKLLEESEGCELVSTELKERRDEVEAGVCDMRVSKKLAKMNSRSHAIKSVAKYVKDAFTLMGPPFVACAARLHLEDARLGSEDDKVEGDNVGNVGGGGEVGITNVSEPEAAQTVDGANNVGQETPRMPNGANNVVHMQNVSLGSEKGDKVVAGESVGPKLGANESEPEAQNVEGATNVGDRVEHETPQKANEANNVGRAQVQVENDNNVMRSGTSLPNATHGVFSSEPVTKEKETPRSTILRRRHGPVKIRDAEDMDMNILPGKYNHVSSAEVRKVQGELESSFVALQASVTDPLPFALHVSETVRSELEMRPVDRVSGEGGGVANPLVDKNTEPDQSDTNNNGNQTSSDQNDVPKPCGKEIDAPNASVVKGKGTEFVQTGDVNPGNASSSHQNNVSRAGLMERNSTTHTFEWNDLPGLTPEQTMNGEGLRLHSPKPNAVTPLKKYETKPIAKRRKIKRWSLHEEEALRKGVEKYGKGNWKIILDAHEDVFDERTQVDLKDKWRNMTK